MDPDLLRICQHKLERLMQNKLERLNNVHELAYYLLKEQLSLWIYLGRKVSTNVSKIQSNIEMGLYHCIAMVAV